MAAHEESLAKVMEEANATFGRLAEAAEAAGREGQPVRLADVTRKAGMELDERVIGELHLPELVFPHPWLPWYCWFPWRPIWCWWWRWRYPWYPCCPWWWHRCHPWL